MHKQLLSTDATNHGFSVVHSKFGNYSDTKLDGKTIVWYSTVDVHEALKVAVEKAIISVVNKELIARDKAIVAAKRKAERDNAKLVRKAERDNAKLVRKAKQFAALVSHGLLKPLYQHSVEDLTMRCAIMGYKDGWIRTVWQACFASRGAWLKQKELTRLAQKC